MFRRFVNRLVSYKGRIKVGADKYGNSYYQKQEMKEGAVVEKRWVEFNNEPDPTAVPVEWTSWLAGTRKGVPTPEEIAALEAHRENVKKMAALYEKEEEKRRMKAKLTQQGVKADDLSLEDMEVMMRQISGGEFQEQGGGEKTTQDDSSRTMDTKLRAGNESAEASVWLPRSTRVTKVASKKPTRVVNPSGTEPSETQGQGESIEPETWRP